MNIFATYSSPKKSATALDDKRVIKMILESAQMLSTAIYFYRGKSPYKPTHINHPCTVWARKSRENYNWLFEHYSALLEEYKHRFGKTHECAKLYQALKNGAGFIPCGSLTKFADCSVLPETYASLSKITDRYRQCLILKWKNDKRKPKWTGRNKPYWYYKFNNNIKA